jgi:hypothetical protein
LRWYLHNSSVISIGCNNKPPNRQIEDPDTSAPAGINQNSTRIESINQIHHRQKHSRQQQNQHQQSLLLVLLQFVQVLSSHGFLRRRVQDASISGRGDLRAELTPPLTTTSTFHYQQQQYQGRLPALTSSNQPIMYNGELGGSHEQSHSRQDMSGTGGVGVGGTDNVPRKCNGLQSPITMPTELLP